MNMLETKIRAALRETGEEIAPGTAPRLQLPGAPRRPGLPPVIRRRWPAWLAPVAAAASVAAVVAASLAIASTFHGHASDTGQSQAAAAHGAPPGPASALRLAPPYFVQLSHFNEIDGGRQADVRSTVTGRTLAKVTPPRPFGMFSWVSGAADDRTFVLAAQRYWRIASGSAGLPAQTRDNNTPTVFFRLTFNPAGNAAQLTRIPLPQKIRSSDLAGMTVSPDGTRLALDLRKSVTIVTLATGHAQTWTWHGSGWIGNWKPFGPIFSWTADGRVLAFQQYGGPNDSIVKVRLLDTSTPPGSLASTRVVTTSSATGDSGALSFFGTNTLLTPDGRRIVTATEFSPRHGPGYQQVTAYSVRTGRPVQFADRFAPPAGFQAVDWTGPAGKVLVVSDPRGKKTTDGPLGGVLGVLTGGTFTPIPHGADATASVAW